MWCSGVCLGTQFRTNTLWLRHLDTTLKSGEFLTDSEGSGGTYLYGTGFISEVFRIALRQVCCSWVFKEDLEVKALFCIFTKEEPFSRGHKDGVRDKPLPPSPIPKKILSNFFEGDVELFRPRVSRSSLFLGIPYRLSNTDSYRWGVSRRSFLSTRGGVEC